MSLNVNQPRIDDLIRRNNDLKKLKKDAEETIKRNQQINSLSFGRATPADYKRDIEIMNLNKQIEGWDAAIKRNQSEIERLQRRELSAAEITANRLQAARTSTITNRVELGKLETGLEEFKKQIAASRATPSTPNTFMGRITQRFTGTKELPKGIEDELAGISLAEATELVREPVREPVRELTEAEKEALAEQIANLGGGKRKRSRRRKTNKKTKRRKTNKRNKKSKKYLK